MCLTQLGVLLGCHRTGGGAAQTPETTESGSVAAPEAGAQTEALAATVSSLLHSAAAEEDEEKVEAVLDALAALGEPAIPQLAAALAHSEENVRLAAARTLAKFNSPNAVDPLLAALNDQSWDVRLAAVEAFGDLRERRAVQPLVERFQKDENPQVRYECLTSLGKIGDPAASGFLVNGTHSDDAYVRMWAMDALCRMADTQAPSLAISLLHDPSVYVTRQVLASCSRTFDTPEGNQALIELALSAGDFQSSVQARRALTVHRQAPGAAELTERIRAAARHALATRPTVTAALLLGDLDDPAATDPLIEALRDPNVFVRHHAAHQLGRIGERRAVPALIKALDDPQPLVAATAYDSLQWFAGTGDAQAQAAVERYKGKKFDQPLPR